MRRAYLFGLWSSLCLLSLGSCSRAPTVLVSVEDIPAETASLHVMPLHAGLPPHSELAPYDLPQPAPGRTTFLLRLPDSFVGDVTVEVGAYKGAGGSSCLLATGSGKLPDLQGQDTNLRVPVQPVTDTVCTGQRPLLLNATPSLGLIDGNETVQLSGWGFTPSTVAQFAGKEAQTQFVSASKISALTPPRVAIGPTEINVVNKNGQSHSRGDLFRYYASTVDFGAVPFNPSSGAKNVSDVIIGNFLPKNPLVSASLVTSSKSLNIIGIVWMTPAQPIPMIDNNAVSPGPGTGPSGLATADMDGDGISDVVVALSGTDQVQVFLSDGNGGLTAQPAMGVQKQPEGVVASDLNGDGRPDIVSANFGADSISLLYTKPGGGFLPMGFVKTSSPAAAHQPISVTVSDVNQDGIKDIAVVNQGGGNINLFIGLGGGLINPSPITLLVGTMPTQIAATDVNRDGIDDLLVVNKGSNNVQVLVNRSKKGSGTINFDTYTLATDTTPESMAFSDLNGDGISDLIVPCSTTNTVNVFLNKSPDGLKGATAQKFAMPSAPVCTSVRLVAAMDIFKDGQMDLAGLCTTGGGILKNQTL